MNWYIAFFANTIQSCFKNDLTTQALILDEGSPTSVFCCKKVFWLAFFSFFIDGLEFNPQYF